MRNKFIIGCIIFSSILFFYGYNKAVARTDGIWVNNAPIQQNLSESSFLNIHPDYIVKAVATYDISARVLGIEKYSMDKASDLSPIDFALGWQRMSSNELLDTLTIRQSGRFYFWHTFEPNYPRNDIETQSANTHLIPASPDIAKQLKNVRKGNIVRLTGYLVYVDDRKNGWHWYSSLVRTDVGNGSCEILYVQKVEILA